MTDGKASQDAVVIEHELCKDLRTRPARPRAAITSRSDMAATIFCTALRAAPSNGPTLTCANATARATASVGLKFSGGSVSDLSRV